jgi:hypothetical protein
MRNQGFIDRWIADMDGGLGDSGAAIMFPHKKAVTKPNKTAWNVVCKGVSGRSS